MFDLGSKDEKLLTAPEMHREMESSLTSTTLLNEPSRCPLVPTTVGFIFLLFSQRCVLQHTAECVVLSLLVFCFTFPTSGASSVDPGYFDGDIGHVYIQNEYIASKLCIVCLLMLKGVGTRL